MPIVISFQSGKAGIKLTILCPVQTGLQVRYLMYCASAIFAYRPIEVTLLQFYRICCPVLGSMVLEPEPELELGAGALEQSSFARDRVGAGAQI